MSGTFRPVEVPDLGATLARVAQIDAQRQQTQLARQAFDQGQTDRADLAAAAPGLAMGQGPEYDNAIARLLANPRTLPVALPIAQQNRQRREADAFDWTGRGAAPAGGAPAPMATPAAMPAGGMALPAGDMSLPRGIRNNNPLNLSYVAGQPGVQGTDGRFGRYASMEDGVAAATRQLQMYGQRGLTTLEQIIGRWAPPSENNTGAYVAAVARATGIDPRAPINLSDAGMVTRLVAAMAQHENGRPIDPGVAFSGVQRALGGAPAAAGGGNTIPAQNAAPGGGQAAPAGINPAELAIIQRAMESGNPVLIERAQRRMEVLRLRLAAQRGETPPNPPAPIRLGDGPQGPAGMYRPRPDGTFERLSDIPPPNQTTVIQGDTVRGRADAATLTEVQKSANDARQLVALFDRAEQAVRRVPEGQGAQLLPIIGQTARALGIEIAGTGEAEVLRSLTNGMAVLQRAPGSGATTDFEMRLFMQAVPRLGNTREGNLRLIDIGRRLARRRQEEAAIWRRHAGEPDLMDRLNALPPVFTEEDQTFLQDATPVNDPGAGGEAPRAGASPVVSAPPPPPRPGEVRGGFRYRNGPPGDPNSWEPVAGAMPQGVP